MARKERITHQYELGRAVPSPDRSTHWWEEDKNAPRRVKRQVKAQSLDQPRWPVVILLLLVVMLVCSALVIFLDWRKGAFVGSPPVSFPTETTSPARMTRISVDTVALRLSKAGFDVDYLVTVYDTHRLAYDAAETHIEGSKALILVFKDGPTTLKWAEKASDPIIYKGTWAVQVPDDALAAKMAQKLSARRR